MSQEQNKPLPTDFKIPYSGKTPGDYAPLTDGWYSCEILSVSPGKQRGGKFEGCAQLVWEMRIISGEFQSRRFRCSTLLEPVDMAGTTDRVLRAVFPAIKQGQEPSVGEMIGGKLECEIKTHLGKDGKQSLYVDLKRVGHYTQPGAAGTIGDYDSPANNSDIPF